MSSEQPSLEDNIRRFLAKEKLQHTDEFKDHNLVVIACCPTKEDEGAEDDEQEDYNVLLIKANQANAFPATWRLPEIELSELPGSIGINYSLRRIVMIHCNNLLTAPDGFCKLLHATKVTPSENAKPTLVIYVAVAYQDPQRLKSAAGPVGLELISMAWLQQNEELFVGDEQDLVAIKSAMRARGIIHDASDERRVDPEASLFGIGGTNMFS